MIIGPALTRFLPTGPLTGGEVTPPDPGDTFDYALLMEDGSPIALEDGTHYLAQEA